MVSYLRPFDVVVLPWHTHFQDVVLMMLKFTDSPLSRQDIINNFVEILNSMNGKDLATLYNDHADDPVIYLGDDLYEVIKPE